MGKQSCQPRTKKKLDLAVEVSSLGLDCHNCNEALKKFRGCNGDPIQPYFVDGKPLDRCPAKIIPIEAKEYIRYYAYYKKGHLLLNGGIVKQPIKLMEIFDIFEEAEFKRTKDKFGEI